MIFEGELLEKFTLHKGSGGLSEFRNALGQVIAALTPHHQNVAPRPLNNYTDYKLFSSRARQT